MKEDVLINLQSKYSGSGYKDLSKDISLTSAKMKELELAGKKTSAEYKKLSADLKQLKTFEGFRKNIDDAGKSTTDFASKLATFGTIVGTIAVAGFVKLAKESFTLGKELAVLTANFQGSSKDMELFRKATAGTVSDAGLIKLSNYASDLGISLKDQAQLFSLAEDAADKYGGSVESNFERVINATDGSAKGLRAVGVSVTEWKKAVEDFEKTNQVKLEQLSDEEQLMTRLNLIYKLTGTTLESVTQKTADQTDILDSLYVTLENVIASFGSGFIEGLKLSDSELKEFNKSITVITENAKKFGADVASFFVDLGKGIKNLENDAKDLVAWLESINPLLEWWNDKTFGDLRKRQFNTDLDSRTEEALAINEQRLINSMLPSREEFERQSRKTTIPKVSTSKGDTQKEKEIVNKIESILKSMSLYQLSLAMDAVDMFAEVKVEPADVANVLKGVRPTIPMVETEGVKADTILNAASELQSSLANAMNILNIGTESFVGRMLGGFDRILNIIQSFLAVQNAISTISAIVKTVSTGGVANIPAVNTGSNTNAYFRVDLNSMNIVKEGSAQLEKYKNSIRVAI